MSAAPATAPVPHEPKTVHEEVHAHSHVDPTRTVCIAIDGSKSSDYALSWAVKNVLKPETDQVVLLHVRPFVNLSLYGGAPFVDYGDAFGQVEEANKLESHQLLIRMAKEVQAQGFHVRAIALRGDAREELLYKIDDLKADLVVMGSRGLGAVSRTFIGSVSDFLVHNLKVPVIVTRLPEA